MNQDSPCESQTTLPAATPFPDPPWRLAGQMWGGLFATERPIQIPAGCRALFGAHRLAVVLFHYTEGTLQYDELILGVPIRRGFRAGLWIRDIWVSSAASLWGGRKLWRVPKQMAQFDWTTQAVEVRDPLGTVASIALESRRHWLAWGCLPAPMFGNLDDQWCFAWAAWRGRMGRPAMRLEKLSERFSDRPAARPTLGFGSDRCRLTVYNPRTWPAANSG